MTEPNLTSQTDMNTHNKYYPQTHLYSTYIYIKESLRL